MKTIWLIGLLFLLLIVAYNKVASAPSDGAQGPDQLITLPVGLLEYVLLHQARYESFPVHAMAGVKACPDPE